MNIQIGRYRKSRNFSVEIDGQLLVVTVYKRGAEAVARYITEHLTQPPASAPQLALVAPASITREDLARAAALLDAYASKCQAADLAQQAKQLATKFYQSA